MNANRYPKALMANIEAARLGAVNHYQVADGILDIARMDVNRATKNGSHILTATRRGNVTIHRTPARGFYKVTRQATVAEVVAGVAVPPIFEGSKAETIAFVSSLYILEA